MMLASIAGPDILIVLAVVLLLLGGTQLPKLARSLGSASHEFKRAHEEGARQALAGAAVPVPAPVPAGEGDPPPPATNGLPPVPTPP